ncbi:MAG: hypothetical protein H0W48_14865 [Methylibium sp.]|nr:hypothetical protein [Methylibium sp.]
MVLALLLVAPVALQAASLRLGGFVDAGTVMRPALPMVGVSYASHVDERVDAALVHRPFHFADEAREEGLRLRSPCDGTPGEGADLLGQLPCGSAALTASSFAPTRGNGLPTLVAPLNGLPAPMLVPRSTELSLKVGRLSEDAVHLSAGTDLVMLAKLRHGLTPDHTLSATALRVGPAHLLAATSDWRLGALGVVSGGVGLFDRGNGTQSRTVLGHDFHFRNVSTGLRWGRSYRPAPGEFAFAISGAAWRALPEDGDMLAATASVHLGRHAQLVVGGREHEYWDGMRARSLSLGSTYQPDDENHIGLTVQHTLAPQPDQRLLLTWQVSLDQ